MKIRSITQNSYFVLLSLFMLLILLSKNSFAQQTFPASNLKVLSIAQDSGDLVIYNSQDNDKITLEIKKQSQDCLVNSKVEKNSLFITSKKSKLDATCTTDIIVRMPSHLSVNIQQGAGSVTRDGSGSNLELSQGAGSISILGYYKELVVKAGASNAKLDLKVHPGEKQKTSVSVEMGSGKIELKLPPKVSVHKKIKGFCNHPDLPKTLKADSINPDFDLNLTLGAGEVVFK